MRTRKIGRDAGNGRFVPLKETVSRPGTTVTETVKLTSKPKR